MVIREALMSAATLVSDVHKAYKSANDHLKLAKESYDNMPRRSVMSMLVHCIYFRDLSKTGTGLADILGYQNKRAIQYGKSHWETHHSGAKNEDLKNLGLAFLRRKDSHNNPSAPELAIVLRGTIPIPHKAISDFQADFQIGLATVNSSDRVLRALELILAVVKEFRRSHPGSKIGMAGHSLGAAIALIVGGCLYTTHNIDIDTHLFNPPLMTIVDVFTAQALPNPSAPFGYGEDNTVRYLRVKFSKLKEVLVQGNPAVDHEWEQFQKLENWIPHFYLNPGDPFCHQYLKFYTDKEVKNSADFVSWQGLLSGLFGANPTLLKNVVPSAHVHVSHWQKDSYRLAHSLRQWHKYTPEHIGLDPVKKIKLFIPRNTRPFSTR